MIERQTPAHRDTRPDIKFRLRQLAGHKAKCLKCIDGRKCGYATRSETWITNMKRKLG